MLLYLAVQLYGQDVAGVAVVADLRALLEVIHVHLSWFCVTDHHHQAAGEEALHNVDIRDFIWREREQQQGYSDGPCVKAIGGAKVCGLVLSISRQSWRPYYTSPRRLNRPPR